MVKKITDMLMKLRPDEQEEISWFLSTLILNKPRRNPVVKAVGGQERIIKLQLRAFQRMPGDVIAEYMTDEERDEYEVLIQ
jgi:hypothetical protein